MAEGLVRCPACDRETPSQSAFCGNCGAPMREECASCGSQLFAGMAFCISCGVPVARGGQGAAKRAAIEEPTEERRLCSVLFVDLVGFTPFAEHTDPEDVRDLLGRYFDRAKAIVTNYGGTLEKFIGDAVMAVWGTPVANEDDAERAVRAGLDVVAAVTELGRTHHEGLAARAGVVTGEVAVTVGREQEGMVIGDPVNAASRIQTAADPGTVLVDEATWRASSSAIAYEARGELTLKGKSERIVAWQALRVVGQRKGLGRAEGLEAPFVGRDDELRLVKELLHATQRERRARLVSITGVPGIGKSRLAWEFLKYVDGLAEDVYWHEGRSAAYGADVTFGALGEMVRMRAGINEADDQDAVRSKLAACLREYVADIDERSWIQSRVGHLLGLGEVPDGDRSELFSAWRALFQRVAEVGVTVLVFEDLQWADQGLIDFIESILEWSRAYPIMVVTLARPELLDRRREWGAGQRSFTSLHLDPLSDDEMRRLLDGLVHGLPDEAIARISARAEGVPLYAVETVRALVDRGVILADGDTYRFEGSIQALQIPETLHALIASRLDALPGDERSLLQSAAVIGSSFRRETLSAVHGADPEAIDEMLRDLVRKEFLRVEDDPRSPEQGQYGFVQGMIGDVAVGMLSRRERSARHLAVASYFEAFDDEELTGIVAGQYASAVRAAPETDTSKELEACAASWLKRAGDRAASLGSPEQALALLDEALQLTRDDVARATIVESAGHTAMQAAQVERGFAYLDEAVGLRRRLGDRAGASSAVASLADYHAHQRHFDEATTLAEAAYLDLGEGGDARVRAHLAYVLAYVSSQTEDRDKAIAWADDGLVAAEELGDGWLLAKLLNVRVIGLAVVGRHVESTLLAKATAAFAEEIGALREQATALHTLALRLQHDDLRKALDVTRLAAEKAQRLGDRRMEEIALYNGVECAIRVGEWEWARGALDELASRRAAEGVASDQSGWREVLLATLEALSGDTTTALERFELNRTEPDGGSNMDLASDLSSRALILLAAGDLCGSIAAGMQAVELDPIGVNALTAIESAGHAACWSRDLAALRAAAQAAGPLKGRRSELAQATLRAGLEALEGHLDEAHASYEEVVASVRAAGCPLVLAQIEIDAVALLGRGRTAAWADEAQGILTEIGATPFLHRLTAEVGQ